MSSALMRFRSLPITTRSNILLTLSMVLDNLVIGDFESAEELSIKCRRFCVIHDIDLCFICELLDLAEECITHRVTIHVNVLRAGNMIK